MLPFLALDSDTAEAAMIESQPDRQLLVSLLDKLASPRCSSAERLDALGQIEHKIALLLLGESSSGDGGDVDGSGVNRRWWNIQEQVGCNISQSLLSHLSRLHILLQQAPHPHPHPHLHVEQQGYNNLAEEAASCLSLLQGLSLSHGVSKQLCGRKSALELLLAIVEAPYCKASCPPSPSALEQMSPRKGSSQPLPPTETTPTTLSLLPSLALDSLICALVGSPESMRAFEQVDGLATVVGVLRAGKRAGAAGRDVTSLKCLEFLFFYLMPEGAESGAMEEAAEIERFCGQDLGRRNSADSAAQGSSRTASGATSISNSFWTASSLRSKRSGSPSSGSETDTTSEAPTEVSTPTNSVAWPFDSAALGLTLQQLKAAGDEGDEISDPFLTAQAHDFVLETPRARRTRPIIDLEDDVSSVSSRGSASDAGRSASRLLGGRPAEVARRIAFVPMTPRRPREARGTGEMGKKKELTKRRPALKLNEANTMGTDEDPTQANTPKATKHNLHRERSSSPRTSHQRERDALSVFGDGVGVGVGVGIARSTPRSTEPNSDNKTPKSRAPLPAKSIADRFEAARRKRSTDSPGRRRRLESLTDRDRDEHVTSAELFPGSAANILAWNGAAPQESSPGDTVSIAGSGSKAATPMSRDNMGPPPPPPVVARLRDLTPARSSRGDSASAGGSTSRTGSASRITGAGAGAGAEIRPTRSKLSLHTEFAQAAVEARAGEGAGAGAGQGAGAGAGAGEEVGSARLPRTPRSARAFAIPFSVGIPEKVQTPTSSTASASRRAIPGSVERPRRSATADHYQQAQTHQSQPLTPDRTDRCGTEARRRETSCAFVEKRAGGDGRAPLELELAAAAGKREIGREREREREKERKRSSVERSEEDEAKLHFGDRQAFDGAVSGAKSALASTGTRTSKTRTRTVEEKRALLGQHLGNVDALVQEMDAQTDVFV